MNDINLWILNVEDRISGVNLGDEVSLQEVTILDIVFTVGDIESNIRCTKFLEFHSRELESSSGRADVINNEDFLTCEVCVRNHIKTKDFTRLEVSLLDTKGDWKIRFFHHIQI